VGATLRALAYRAGGVTAAVGLVTPGVPDWTPLPGVVLTMMLVVDLLRSCVQALALPWPACLHTHR
jgi:hypothetical protein